MDLPPALMPPRSFSIPIQFDTETLMAFPFHKQLCISSCTKDDLVLLISFYCFDIAKIIICGIVKIIICLW